MLRTLPALLCGLAISTTAVFADPPIPFPDALVDPAFLVTRTWKADEGLDSVTRNWLPYTGEQGFEDRTVTRRSQVTLLGRPFDAEYRVLTADSLLEIVFIGNRFDELFCSELFDWASKHLGKPSTKLDRSKDALESVHIEADWTIGEGRVQISCAGVKIGDGSMPGLAMLVYRHQSHLRRLVDFVYIECSSTKRYVGKLSGSSTEDEAALTFIVDPNSSKILRRDKRPFLDTRKFTDEQIVASIQDEKRSDYFVLDRVTGNYQWQTRLKNDKNTGLDRWGKCLRIDPGKKF